MSVPTDEFLPTRLSLLGRVKDWGDQQSWQDFFDTYHRLIHSVALKAGLSPTEAQDVVQETVLSVAKKIGDFRADPARGSFKGWLMVITRRRIADQFEKRARANPNPHPACGPPLPSGGRGAGGEGGQRPGEGWGDDDSRTATINRVPDPASLELDACWEEQGQQHVFAAAVERVKRAVSPSQFQMFELYTLRDWPVKRVAQTLGVSVASVYLAKHRVGAALRREVRRLERFPEFQGQDRG